MLARAGYKIELLQPLAMEDEFLVLQTKVKAYTMTSIERQYALYQAVRYVLTARITGDFVECGVWKGGSSMLMACTLLEHGVSDREFYLYDTFAGMSEPTEKDVNVKGTVAKAKWAALSSGNINTWDYASLSEVRQNVFSTGYPANNIHFIEGKVEDTIPRTIPDKIALLRLDTDWYESTLHELEYLFPRLVPGGVLIIDDYGHWQGARQAVDEYFKKNNVRMLLNRIDYTGRIGVK